jgi:2-phospho-L-lactate transferase/gluconeogenesis factor (CofD/UPF0052 family)
MGSIQPVKDANYIAWTRNIKEQRNAHEDDETHVRALEQHRQKEKQFLIKKHTFAAGKIKSLTSNEIDFYSPFGKTGTGARILP